MLYKLLKDDYERVRSLLEPLAYNLCILSLLNGKSPGQIFTDHPAQPSAVLVDMGHHVFLAGSPEIDEFNQSLGQFFQKVWIPNKRAAKHEVFILHFSSDDWKEAARQIFAGQYPVERIREYYECTHLCQNWRSLLPDRFTLQPVDADLVSQDHLANIDYLREELCSERPTIQAFLENSFGFAVLHNPDLTAWCLSEYNTENRCEVGVATVDAYQRRGLGTITSLALVEHALTHGYQRVGWHCWKSNIPSSALAKRAGFAYIRDYPVFFCVLNLAVQYGINGRDALNAGDDASALSWYRKSTTAPEGAPEWVYYDLARCLARLGQPDPAIQALKQAAARGFDDFENARAEADFQSLSDHPEWDTIVSTQPLIPSEDTE